MTSSDSLLLTSAERDRIRSQLGAHDWYRSLFDTFRARVDELIDRSPSIPLSKGRAFFESCPDDATRLVFDPYRPQAHVCPTCGRDWQGDVYDQAWVRQYQDWLGKRLVEAGIVYRLLDDGELLPGPSEAGGGAVGAVGTVGAVDASSAAAAGETGTEAGGDGRAIGRASRRDPETYARLVRDSLAHFVQHYEDYPLANNLLGPTRLFQSTYLEAFWLVDMVAAYDLTRSSQVYSDADHRGVRDLLYGSASVIRSYDEGRSNRQAFNNAGMGAVALLYEDAELVHHVLSGPHGFAFHMRESVLADGLWYEGETYHFATLEHTLNLAEMARHRGIDLYHGASGHGALRPMFDGPLGVLLPDLTFPSRKDSWFGRGIGYHRDIYELGYARYGDERFGGLLAHAYATGEAERTELGWRSFLHLDPELPEVRMEDADDVHRPSVAELLPKQSERMPGTGVAVLRRDGGRVYAGLEYGHYGGGHGHPDRLHLTLFAEGVHWLLDPGTGWYHVPELAWYRSTLAHNTISVDRRLQDPREGSLTAFGEAGGYGVAQALVTGVAEGVHTRRTLLLGDGWLLDILDADDLDGREHDYDVAFHTAAEVASGAEGSSPGGASALGTRDGYEFLQHVQRLEAGPFDLRLRQAGAEMRVLRSNGAETYRATAPGVPALEGEPAAPSLATILTRRRGIRERVATLWAWGADRADIRFRQDDGARYLIERPGRRHEVLVGSDGAAVATREDGRLAGLAWFGTQRVVMGELELAADQPLPQAALRREAEGWRAYLPAAFGSIGIRAAGLEGPVEGLPAGASYAQENDSLRLVQASDASAWFEATEPVTLFAGCSNTLGFATASYGSARAVPRVQLPNGWHLRDLALADDTTHGVDPHPTPVRRWRARVEVPAVPEQRGGTLRIRADTGPPEASPRVASNDPVGVDWLEVDAIVEPPVRISWQVRSSDGIPALSLEVRNARAEACDAQLDLRLPWSTSIESPWSLRLPEKGSVSIDVPLPSEPGSAGRREDNLATELHELARLPGGAGWSGEFPVEATVRVESFAGVGRAELPLYWCRPADDPRPPQRIVLGRQDQALWADRPWKGPEDASAQATLQRDAEGLTLRCEVVDDRFVADASDEDLYENDSLQVYFDFRSAHHGDRSFNTGVAGYVLAPDAQLRTVRIRPIAGNREISNRGARAEWFTVEGVEASVRRIAPQSYEIRARFPYASLGVEPLLRGQVIGFDLALSDNDGTWYRNTQLVWSGARGRRCYIRGSYHDPREFGWLIAAE